jgi:hypothetical protein
VTGLWETLRFIIFVSGLVADVSKAAVNQAIELAKVEPSKANEQGEARLWVTKQGDVFGYMEEWLNDEDIAAWWCHPGQLVKLTRKEISTAEM